MTMSKALSPERKEAVSYVSEAIDLIVEAARLEKTAHPEDSLHPILRQAARWLETWLRGTAKRAKKNH